MALARPVHLFRDEIAAFAKGRRVPIGQTGRNKAHGPKHEMKAAINWHNTGLGPRNKGIHGITHYFGSHHTFGYTLADET